HWEPEAEGFLMLSGEALLLIEGEERPLRTWDYVHCPPGANHVIVGAGDGSCIVLAMGSRANQAHGPRGAYTVDEVALTHGAGVREETQDVETAYGHLGPSTLAPYGDGWLPGE